MGWATRGKHRVPAIHSPQQQYELNDYSLGMNSFLSNDKMPLNNGGKNLWRLAQNARMLTLGEYETRKGFDFYSAAAGETLDQSQASTTGANTQFFTETIWKAQKWTAAANGSLSKYEVRLRNSIPGIGTVIIEHWTDSSNAPGVMVARSSIAGSALSVGSFTYITARFPDAPTVASGSSYWIVAYIQTNGSGSYEWSSTTSGTTGKTSLDSGVSWISLNLSMNFRQYYATASPVIGLYRAYKSDGTKKTLFCQTTSVYSVSDVDGSLTTVKSGLNGSTEKYRFTTINDTVYYVNGYDGLRKWDFTTESQVNSTNYTLITSHKGLLFLAGGADPNAVVFSNFGLPEVFTSTDFVYADVPKNGDPVTALVSLNGALFMITRNNKLILSGDNNETFSVSEAPDQKGTFTQETVCVDKNYMYFLSDDGMYRSNGSEAQLMSEGIYNEIQAISNKEDCVVNINKGRLYLWYPSPGSAVNDRCFVWNLNYGSGSQDCVESMDTKAYVNRAFSEYLDNDTLIVGSSKLGQVYYQELTTNDYTNLGGDIDFELQTHYMMFGNPAQLHEIRYWNPRFSTSSSNNTVTCQYAYDLNPTALDVAEIDVQGNGYIWGDPGTIWGSFFWGVDAEVQGSLYVPGEYRRIQLRYNHYATRQKVTFLGSSLVVQTRRLR